MKESGLIASAPAERGYMVTNVYDVVNSSQYFNVVGGVVGAGVVVVVVCSSVVVGSSVVLETKKISWDNQFIFICSLRCLFRSSWLCCSWFSSRWLRCSCRSSRCRDPNTKCGWWTRSCCCFRNCCCWAFGCLS